MLFIIIIWNWHARDMKIFIKTSYEFRDLGIKCGWSCGWPNFTNYRKHQRFQALFRAGDFVYCSVVCHHQLSNDDDDDKVVFNYSIPLKGISPLINMLFRRYTRLNNIIGTRLFAITANCSVILTKSRKAPTLLLGDPVNRERDVLPDRS
jgi:hypothetical protein